jgi:hypothetical protein
MADFAKLSKQLEQAKAVFASAALDKDEPSEEEPKQLSLF